MQIIQVYGKPEAKREEFQLEVGGRGGEYRTAPIFLGKSTWNKCGTIVAAGQRANIVFITKYC